MHGTAEALRKRMPFKSDHRPVLAHLYTLDREPFASTTFRGATLKGWEPADSEEERRYRELACQAVLEAVEGRGEVPIQKLEESLVAAAQR
eukprot:5058206-Heterocapsa_arctica.AAC.1